MAAREKGTLTSLSSIFPSEEARKASQRVRDTLIEKRVELDNLHRFADDNTTLINLVERLPDQLHHHIMVPFGRAAFFPGRLVHTNEFLVLLGEGYFAERTAKQTVDILKRRGKILESQVDSLMAVIDDLKAEASFFDKTAAEAEEGLVEIREEDADDEEDLEESQEKSDVPSLSEVDSGTAVIDDEEYVRIMSRLDELEKEELEAEDTMEQDDDEHDDFGNLDHEHSRDQFDASELSDISRPTDPHNGKNLSLQPWQRGESSHGKDLLKTHVERSAQKDYIPSVTKTSVHSVSKSKSEISAPVPKPDAGSLMSRPFTESLKAFTGSIIERTENLQINLDKETTSQPSNSQPSKPVSRFKMQRRVV